MLMVCARRHDFHLRAFHHPFITDFRQQMDVQLIGEKEGFCGQQTFDQRANAGEFGDAK